MANQVLTKEVAALGKRFSDVTISMHEAIARQAGLTGTDHKYLSLLRESGPMTAGELAQRAGLTTGAVTGVIDRLEKRKLVKREFSKDDRRKVTIVPNADRIARLLGKPFGELSARIVGLVGTLTKTEKATVEKYLLDAINIMEEVTAGLAPHKKQKP
ncbi:MAG: MarR family transcriptional regulator [Chitinophagaceae bacterium]|nr:MAG: MarR family transcriptional regulator [Chitinophagaceae bacterium]